jgi:alkylated DNA repair protein (DNA oxidative demethylase)
MIPDLFRGQAAGRGLGGFARPFEGPLIAALQRLVKVAPFRHMVTSGRHRMSVAMTKGGTVGWVSDRTGYRCVACDPESGRHWPPLPEVFGALTAQARRRGQDSAVLCRTRV